MEELPKKRSRKPKSNVYSPSSSKLKSKRIKAEEVPEKPQIEAVETTKKHRRKPKSVASSSSSTSSSKKKRKSKKMKVEEDEELETDVLEDMEEFVDELEDEDRKEEVQIEKRKDRSWKNKKRAEVKHSEEPKFVGGPIPVQQARLKWPDRYDADKKKAKIEKGEPVLNVFRHYSQAEIDGCIFNLMDDASIEAEDDEPDYIGRIVEFFQTTDKKNYFTAQWFFKPEDTVIKGHSNLIEEKRVFYSDIRDDNPLGCILTKITIVKIASSIDLEAKKEQISACDFYYDMTYSIPYCTFKVLPTENVRGDAGSSSTILGEASCEVEQGAAVASNECSIASTSKTPEMTLLDLYAGCGGMSTGLCLGAALSGVNLVTRWAVDMNQYACESLKANHPETEVRIESAEDFLSLLKRWQTLCGDLSLLGTQPSQSNGPSHSKEEDDDVEDGFELPPGEFEVGKLVGICFGDPNECKKAELHFKVRWRGYGPDDDTWEPLEGLEKCEERIQDFVINGFNSKILPLPGDVDVICGGPPCQGVSGFNRFRDKENPLNDPKNYQLEVFMDIVNHLKPKYVLMENVVDLMKFAGGFLGRYALSRLIAMSYQARIGLMVAGCYGLPQFRMRVFLWGACRTEKLPQYPLPTHKAVARGFGPTEFEACVVAYNDNPPDTVKDALNLRDAISDLPEVTNYETKDEIPYAKAPTTEFQRQIRMRKHELLGAAATGSKSNENVMLYDHLPYKCNVDDYQRVCKIPRQKGANFRNLPGVIVRADKTVGLDETVEREMLPSGKPLVPDYALTFVKGKSLKPFGRLWWDEIVPTVVTRPEPHNQAILHPEQDRVLSIRENARLQGFPDYYKLYGPVKERYIQVGNAVAVPVARALGYALGLASQGICGEDPLLTLPLGFPDSLQPVHSAGTDVVEDVI